MKYFISLDMEGVAGLASWSETSQEQRELMTGETCAAIEGIRSVDGDAAILIADSHSRGQNLILDRLPQDVQVVRGYPRPLYMVEGADETCDAALFVGYHAPVGTHNGSMDHTYSSSAIYEVLANGHVVGETELNMVLLSRLGIPFIFGSGDEEYCRFSRQFFPHAGFVITKWATGRYSQRTLMPEASKTSDPQRSCRCDAPLGGSGPHEACRRSGSRARPARGPGDLTVHLDCAFPDDQRLRRRGLDPRLAALRRP